MFFCTFIRRVGVSSIVGRCTLRVGGVSLLCILSACGGNVRPLSGRPFIEESSQKVQSVAEVQRLVELKKRQQRGVRIERLVDQAETALLNGRLTLPEHDNAYDRFSAVLILDEENVYAQRGIRRILLAYVARVHQALARGELSYSRKLLARVKLYYPNNPLVSGLTSKLEEAQQAILDASAEAEKLEVDSGHRVSLPINALSQKGEAIGAILSEVAARVVESDEGVMIHARTDAEGRWIYQTMKRAAGNYRIRGDIRIHRKPGIVFIAPLEEESFSD